MIDPQARVMRCSSLLLLLQLPLVEGELLALEHIAVDTAALARPGGHASQQAAALELLLNGQVQLLPGLAGLQLGDHMATLLLRLLALLGILGVLVGLLAALAQVDTELLQVPLLVRLRIDLHDGVLGQGLGAHQLVASRIVDHIQDTNLLRAILRAPSEVAAVLTQGAELQVATAATHRAHTLGAELAQGCRAAHLELALLLVDVATATRLPVLVTRITRNTHGGWEKTLALASGSRGFGQRA